MPADIGGLTARQQLLLIFLLGSNSLDPIRIMKGMFLFSQECPKNWISDSARYQFSPYDWGPYSRDVYGDLKILVERGFLKTTPAPGRDWDYYEVTKTGGDMATAAAKRFDVAVPMYLHKLHEFVASVSFSTLLKTIYDKYPKFAVKSVFRG